MFRYLLAFYQRGGTIEYPFYVEEVMGSILKQACTKDFKNYTSCSFDGIQHYERRARN